MPSSTSSFERPVPAQPWNGIVLAVVLLTAAAATGWELVCRHAGYGPTLNDTPDLWAERRRAVQPDSIVVIGDSRPHFDVDLDEIQRGLGQRPVQLAIDGSCGYPVLADLAADERFHGTVICSIVPLMWLVPAGPPLENAEKSLRRYHHGTVSQWTGHKLGMLLEEHVAFLKSGELDLAEILRRLPIPDRPHAMVPPRLPPYFNTLDRERRARMTEKAETSPEYQHTIQQIWMRLFTPPPPPTYVPREAFMAGVGQAIEARFRHTAEAVHRIRARGGKVVFVRFPNSGDLAKHEDALTPRPGPWTRLIQESGAPGLYWSDYPELASFHCPEWSHLSAPDSVEFTRRLVPHLKDALK